MPENGKNKLTVFLEVLAMVIVETLKALEEIGMAVLKAIGYLLISVMALHHLFHSMHPPQEVRRKVIEDEDDDEEAKCHLCYRPADPESVCQCNKPVCSDCRTVGHLGTIWCKDCD